MKPNNIVLIVFALITVSFAQPPQQPVIGIYTQDTQDFAALTGSGTMDTYIAASYVKNIEMAGGQVVPIFYHYSTSQLESLLSKLNGVFFPGGEMPIDIDNQWTSNTAFIIEYANKQNLAGNPYPIWATCLGYEAVMYIHSGLKDNMTVLTEVFGQNGSSCPLKIKNSNSVLLKSLNANETNDATTGEGIFYFHHRWSITEKTYRELTGINSFWKLITTTSTQDGVEFVSTVQAYDFPYFMTQYHPEKNSFEWRIDAKRTYNAISAEQKFINQFMKVARLNKNKFSDEELSQKIIYNYQPTLLPLSAAFVQVYIFDESKI